jgi:hypothetical protein
MQTRVVAMEEEDGEAAPRPGCWCRPGMGGGPRRDGGAESRGGEAGGSRSGVGAAEVLGLPTRGHELLSGTAGKHVPWPWRRTGRQRPDLDVGTDRGWEVDREGPAEQDLAASGQVGAGSVREPARSTCAGCSSAGGGGGGRVGSGSSAVGAVDCTDAAGWPRALGRCTRGD